MFIYVARNYTASIAGAVVRDVSCEKCGCAYHYRLIRRGQGTGTAPYYLGQGGAERRAQTGAINELEHSLAREIDPVPCPDCGWFQAEMVREIERRSFRWLKTVALVGGIVAAGALAIFAASASGGLQHALRTEDQLIAAVLTAAFVIAAFGPVMLRRAILRARDPNRLFPQHPTLIPGAPRPWKDDEDGSVAVTPPPSSSSSRAMARRDNFGPLAYPRTPPEVEPGGWVTVQLLDMPVPAECCMCLSATLDTLALKKNDLVVVPVKVCAECRSALKGRRWRWALGTVMVCAAAAFGFTLLPDVARQMGTPLNYIFTGGIAFVALIIGLVSGEKFAKPAKLGRFDSHLNTLRIRFNNRDYRPLFAGAMAAMPPAGPTSAAVAAAAA